MLAARLLFAVQRELFDRLRELGFDDVRPRHGAVLAYLDEVGVRPGDLARQSGRRKQTIGAILETSSDSATSSADPIRRIGGRR